MAKQTYEALFLLSGQLAGSFGSTFKGAAKHFESLKGAATGFNNAVVGGFKRVGSALTSIPAQMAGLGAGVGLVAMGKHAIDLAADMEKLGTAMTVHLGSASKAQALIGEIQKFATETPFEFKELATAGKQMLAFGFAGDQVVTNLRMLGDVASGLSMPIGDLVYLFGTLKAQGRAFQSDINQFTNRGIPIYDALTKSITATAKAQGDLTIKVGEGKKAMNVPLSNFGEQHIRTMVEAGQIGFKQIEAAFKQLTGEGGKFFGMIEAQSRTFSGRLSTMKDNVNNLFLQIGQPITDTLSPFLAEINASPVWANMAEGITNTLVPAVQGLIVALKSGLGGTITQLGSDFMGLVNAVGRQFGASRGPTLPMQPKAENKSVYGQLSKMKMPNPVPRMGMAPISGGGEYQSTLGSLTKMAEMPPPDMTWVKTAEGMVKQLSEAFKWLAANMDKVVLAVQLLAGAFAAAQLVGLIAAIANPIGLVVVAVTALSAGLVYLVTNWNNITAAMNAAWEAIQQWAQGESTKFLEKLDEILRNLSGGALTLKGVIEGLVGAWNAVASAAGAAAQAIAGAFSQGAPQGGKGAGDMGAGGAPGAWGQEFAAGGIVTRPTFATVGEAGPEAVVPLKRSSRSLGLLNAAANALGAGGTGGGSIVNFQPNVTINGGGNPEILTALDNKLKELSRDFLAEYEAAHRNVRRLAFG